MERARQFEVQLTERQQQVWRLVAKGHTNGEIAERLGISLDGAKWHVGELLSKLGADTREDLVEAWDSQRPWRRLMRHAYLPALFPKAAAGSAIAAVAAVVAVGGVALSLVTKDDGHGAEDQGSALSLNLPEAPEGAVLDPMEAYRRAEATAKTLLDGELAAYLQGRSVRPADLVLTAARFLSPGESFGTPDNMVSWESEDAQAAGGWAFAWTGEEMGFVELDALGGPGDIQLAVVIEDSTQSPVLGTRAQVIVSRAGIWEYGSLAGFVSTRPLPNLTPAGEVVPLAWLNDVVGGAQLVAYRREDGMLCTRQIQPTGWASGSCGMLWGATRSKALSVLGRSGSGFTVVDGARIENGPSSVVRTDPDVLSLGLVDAAGGEERFATHEINGLLGMPYRIAYFSSEALNSAFWLVAYDASGGEVYRQGPWEPGVSVPEFSESID